jgi:hypothetical protein
MPRKYLLYAQTHSYVFSLREDGEPWLKEFPSISDAISYAASLPKAESATMTIYDPTGVQLAELRVQNEVMTTA